MRSSPRRKILVIDDHECNRDILTDALESQEHEVYAAENGLEALKMLNEGLNPCIIYCDLDMPVLNGQGFCRALRADPKIAHIPVIIVSGNPDIEDIASEIGATTYIPKPVSGRQLRGTLFEIEAASSLIVGHS